MSTGLLVRVWAITDKSYYQDCLVIKGYLNKNVYHWILIKCQEFKSFVEKYRSNLTNREEDYLISFKWESSNMLLYTKNSERWINSRSDRNFKWRLYGSQAFFQAFFYNLQTVVKTRSWIELWNSISSCFFLFFVFEIPLKDFPFYSPVLLALWFR